MARRLFVFLALATLALAAPSVVQAQLPPAPVPKPPPTVIDPKIAAFARVYAEVTATKEEYLVRFARVHDAPGREAWRVEYDAKIAEILAARGMTRAQYDEMVRAVSTDPVLLPQFEVALKNASAG